VDNEPAIDRHGHDSSNRSERWVKGVYIALHLPLFALELFLIWIVIGSLAWTGLGPPSASQPPPPRVPYGLQQAVALATVAATFVCIVLPLSRRGFGLTSIAGSIALALLLWINVLFQAILDDGDPSMFATFAAFYTAVIVAPFGLFALHAHRRKLLKSA
jgi:hypothetical protein